MDSDFIQAVSNEGPMVYLTGQGRVWMKEPPGNGGAMRLTSPPGVRPGTFHTVDTPGRAVQIAAGRRHAVVRLADGSVVGVGHNDQGQLGMNPSVLVESRQAVVIPGLSQIIQVAAGPFTTYALDAEGSVWATRAEAVEPDGHGGLRYRLRSRGARKGFSYRIAGLKDIRQIAGGDNFLLALDQKGRVWTNQFSRRKFEQVQGVPPSSGIGCTRRHAFAVADDRRVAIWSTEFGLTVGRASPTAPSVHLVAVDGSSFANTRASVVAGNGDGKVEEIFLRDVRGQGARVVQEVNPGPEVRRLLFNNGGNPLPDLAGIEADLRSLTAHELAL